MQESTWLLKSFSQKELTIVEKTLNFFDPLVGFIESLFYKKKTTSMVKSKQSMKYSGGICQAGGLFQHNTEDIRPIDLFTNALETYKLKQERTQEEAKLLRTLIYCFKGSNIYECVRDTDKLDDRYPKKIREGYFERLRKYFPNEAKRTPYWY